MNIRTNRDIGDTVYAVWRHYSIDNYGIMGPITVSGVDVSVNPDGIEIMYFFEETDEAVQENRLHGSKELAKAYLRLLNRGEL